MIGKGSLFLVRLYLYKYTFSVNVCTIRDEDQPTSTSNKSGGLIIINAMYSQLSTTLVSRETIIAPKEAINLEDYRRLNLIAIPVPRLNNALRPALRR